ncbi:MAG TPA: maleylpyruvate isomerase family mycothiol-dependent enzyme [Acidimicrobiales bacterium]|nr:maleylpyruvate isomerase family mycothiol-dependent enzyme [Acidimicrobiales bacterium]
MDSPYLTRIESATARLLHTVAGLDDLAVGEPSLCPGWDRAMVITHLAANADGLSRVVEAASKGQVGEFYPGGAAARQAEIEAGRASPALELERRLAEACAHVMAVLVDAPQKVWDAPALHISGEVKIGPGPVVGRLREVEIHHVDLNCAYRPEDWPFGWVLEEMDRAMLGLPGRLPPGVALVLQSTDAGQRWVAGSGDAVEVAGPTAELFAWVTGRAAKVAGQDCPALGPWR